MKHLFLALSFVCFLAVQVSAQSIVKDRELASAWAPYTFHRNGQFSHKGIDSFQFVKLKEGWKIQYLIYNMYQ